MANACFSIWLLTFDVLVNASFSLLYCYYTFYNQIVLNLVDLWRIYFIMWNYLVRGYLIATILRKQIRVNISNKFSGVDGCCEFHTPIEWVLVRYTSIANNSVGFEERNFIYELIILKEYGSQQLLPTRLGLSVSLFVSPSLVQHFVEPDVPIIATDRLYLPRIWSEFVNLWNQCCTADLLFDDF